MGLTWNEKERRYEWTGSVRDLVAAVGDGDARLGFVVDLKSGAKISMNISGSDDPLAIEPFDIETPDGENMYDASNRREAVKLLSNIRKGMKHPDVDCLPTAPWCKAHSPPKKKAAAKKSAPRTSIRGLK